MNYSTLLTTQQDRVSTITLNRPERRNALDDVMIRELTEAFGAANRQANSRIVVLTGSGTSFCAGMDLEYLRRYSQLSHEENLEDARNLMKLLQAIYGMKKPVLAMLNGPAMGGGCGLAAACDFVYASREKAKMGAPEVRLGFLPALILMFLMKRMGEAAAREFALRGDILDAETARGRGLVTEVVPDELLGKSVAEFCETFCTTTSQNSIALTKDLFANFDHMNSKDALEYAANLNALARKTDDFKKGLGSFLNKEKLTW
jgi:methylglutaconyl-CoA hydratase